MVWPQGPSSVLAGLPIKQHQKHQPHRAQPHGYSPRIASVDKHRYMLGLLLLLLLLLLQQKASNEAAGCQLGVLYLSIEAAQLRLQHGQQRSHSKVFQSS